MAGWSGIAAGVLFSIANAIWALEMPEDGTPVPEVLDFYRETADRIVVGGSLSLISIAVFVLFAAAVRQVLIEAGAEDFLATTAFGGAVLGMAAGLGAETINLLAALRARDDELSPALGQALFEIPQVLGAIGYGLGLGIFAIATGAAALRTKAVLPRREALAVVVLGVLVLTPLAHMNWVAGAAGVVVALVIGIRLLRTG